MYVRAMAQTTRTPVHRFDSQGNPPSGQSLRVAEQPFIKKVKYRQNSFGARAWSAVDRASPSSASTLGFL